MAIPSEYFVLRIENSSVSRIDVLDVAATTSSGDIVAFCSWELGDVQDMERAGFALIRIDLMGDVKWQLCRSLCGPGPGDACGQWALQSGAVTRIAGGFLAVATIARAGTNVWRMIAVRVADDGSLVWLKSYTTPAGGCGVTGRAAGVVPLAAADMYLVAARSAETFDSWFFQLAGDGTAGNGFIVPNRVVRRLRRLPTQGVCAVGETADRIARGWALDLDPATLTPKWERVYDLALPTDNGVRWHDIAEGKESLMIVGSQVGSSGEIIGLFAGLGTDFTPTPAGQVARWVQQAQLPNKQRSRLNGVSAHRDSDFPHSSFFSFCGEVSDTPWQIAINEQSGSVLWQKAYRLNAGATGTLRSTVWPAEERVIAGGHVVEGKETFGALASSIFFAVASKCAFETHAEFPSVTMPSPLQPSPMSPLVIRTDPWFHEAARTPLIARGCLDRKLI